MNWFKRNIVSEDVEAEDENKDNAEIKNTDKWIWIEGYKGTDIDMKCRGFEYELHKQYDIDGEVKECENGFHLCRELKEVFRWYSLSGNSRFFKVKSLVRKEDYDSYYKRREIGWISAWYDTPPREIAAKSIIFEEEMTYSNGLKEYIHNQYKFIENEQEYACLKCDDYENFRKRKFITILKDIGYSELFSNVLYKDKMRLENEDQKLFETITKAKAFNEENVSKEMSVYLLLNS